MCVVFGVGRAIGRALGSCLLGGGAAELGWKWITLADCICGVGCASLRLGLVWDGMESGKVGDGAYTTSRQLQRGTKDKSSRRLQRYMIDTAS